MVVRVALRSGHPGLRVVAAQHRNTTAVGNKDNPFSELTLTYTRQWQKTVFKAWICTFCVFKVSQKDKNSICFSSAAVNFPMKPKIFIQLLGGIRWECFRSEQVFTYEGLAPDGYPGNTVRAVKSNIWLRRIYDESCRFFPRVLTDVSYGTVTMRCSMMHFGKSLVKTKLASCSIECVSDSNLTCPVGCLRRDSCQSLSCLDCSWTAGPASEGMKGTRSCANMHVSYWLLCSILHFTGLLKFQFSQQREKLLEDQNY